MKYCTVLLMVFALFSCDTDPDCRTCPGDREVVFGNKCICGEDYLQLGNFPPPRCAPRESDSNYGGRCVIRRDRSFYFQSEDDCYCSPYSVYDSVVVDLNVVAGDFLNVENKRNRAVGGQVMFIQEIDGRLSFRISGINFLGDSGGPTRDGICQRIENGPRPIADLIGVST